MSQPDYKDTVSSWLGEIPAAWEVRRLKTLISQPITDGPHETPEFLPDGIPFLSVDGIQNGDLVFDGCRYISQAAHKEYQRKCAPRYNDILIGKAASTGKIARVKVDFEFSVWSPLALIRPNQAETQPNFLEYALKNVTTQAQIDCLCTANTQKNISMRDIPTLLLCIPNAKKQRCIANYLDEQAVKIDRLVDMRRRQMELLKEQRAALIQQAVTRGLNPNAPMKDSGLPWLGEIPAHWEMKRLKHIAHFVQTGGTPPSGNLDYYDDNGMDWYGPGDFSGAIRLNASARKISGAAIRDGYATAYEPPVILIVGIGASVGKIGLATQQCYTNQQVNSVGLRDGHSAAFFANFLAAYSNIIAANANHATLPIFNQTQTRNFCVVVPPPLEQLEIIEFIQREEMRFDRLLSAYSRQLTLLAEYRAALIHECVTGQRPVPEPSSPDGGNAHAL